MNFQLFNFKVKFGLAFILVLLTYSFLLFPSIAHASDQFAVDAIVTYKIDDFGKTLVTHDITLENLYSTFYATTYTLTLENIKVGSVKAIDDNNVEIPKTETEDEHHLAVKLTFSDAVVGKGAKRHFVISYENSNFAVKTGEIWEISIPRLTDNESFRDYYVKLNVPTAFGQEAYVSPAPTSFQDLEGYKSYTFDKSKINQTGVTAGFGQFQVFTFNLSYHLENPLNVNSQTEISIPPDTAFQKVYFTKMDPAPSSVKIDPDGNYLAIYKLTPRQRVDVNVEGAVQIFAGFRPFLTPSKEVLDANLKPTKYWQSDDPLIIAESQNLKTPEAIYNFVTSKLKYDLSRVQPNVARMGAVNALANPSQAICMEFTDLFVALSRAAGIPAREINGYAYTENKELQPLGLVADVLHSWPEYYDQQKGVWIPVDPTWGSTSGVDFFNKLDLRHFTFVIHGSNDKEPYPPGSYKLGPNPQKDVFVSFGQLPVNRNSIPKITLSTDRNIPFLDMLYSYNIYNPGPSTLYSFYPTVSYDANLRSRDLVQILPPFTSYKSKITIPYSLLAKNMPDNITVAVNESAAVISTNKSHVVINSLIVLFALFALLVILVLIKLKKIRFEKLNMALANFYFALKNRFRSQ